MLRADLIRRLKQAGLGCVLGLTVRTAVTQTSPPPPKPAPPSSATAATANKSTKRTKPTSSQATGKRTSSRAARNTRTRKVATKRGQQGIDSPRAREIQTALIRENYMHGEPSGMWDSATQDAMRRYQADHGWQSKTIPDSRARIGLGLGPSSDHLLNPESAMTAAPAASDPKAVSKAAGNNIPQQ